MSTATLLPAPGLNPVQPLIALDAASIALAGCQAAAAWSGRNR